MIGPAAMCAALLFLSAGFIALGVVMTLRLTPEANQRPILKWLGAWLGKGVLLPAAGWAVMNLGMSWAMPAYMPQVQAAQNSGPWFGVWLRISAEGLFIISSYWAAITLGWVLISKSRVVEPDSYKEFRALCFTCAAGLGLPAILLGMLGGWTTLGLAAIIVLAPIAGYAPAVLQPRKVTPMYARAIARMKFGKYSEAEWEIIRELEKCEDDYDGWMMLADLYATHFGDIAEAARTVMEICDQRRTTPSQLSVALHRLADWHLKAGDAAAARRALQVIIDRVPGSHLARMAQLRLNQLPHTAAELREQRTASVIPLPALGDRLDRDENLELPPMERKQAARMANACVEQLKIDPNNVPAREKVARLFAEHLGRADLGIEQLQLLLGLAGQADNKRAEWLALIAAWHLKHRDDTATACRVLERLVAEFPETAQAFSARRRLEQIKKASR